MAEPFLQDHPYLKGQVKETYERALSFSRLRMHEQVSYRNVKIYQKQYLHEIYTCKGAELPHLVFLHGFGGTSLTAVRLFYPLHTHYQVHALDIYGIGYSSRGNYSEDFTYEQTVNYYIDAIEEWRKTLGIQKFLLVGHSFGGYLASCYARKYRESVTKLVLLSPAGSSRNRIVQEQNCRTKFMVCIAAKIFRLQFKPTSIMSSFFFGKKIIISIVQNRLKLEGEEKDVWISFLTQLGQQATSSETGFYKIFDFPVIPKISIEQMITEDNFGLTVDFYYGDTDWMDSTGVKELAEKHPNINLYSVPNCGHQMVFDQPQQISARILSRQN